MDSGERHSTGIGGGRFFDSSWIVTYAIIGGIVLITNHFVQVSHTAYFLAMLHQKKLLVASSQGLALALLRCMILGPTGIPRSSGTLFYQGKSRGQLFAFSFQG